MNLITVLLVRFVEIKLRNSELWTSNCFAHTHSKVRIMDRELFSTYVRIIIPIIIFVSRENKTSSCILTRFLTRRDVYAKTNIILCC